MVKRIKRAEPKEEAIEEWGEMADRPEKAVIKKQPLNPNAARNFKSYAIRFNEFEWNQLAEAAEKMGLGRNAFIRYAINKAAKEVLSDGQERTFRYVIN